MFLDYCDCSNIILTVSLAFAMLCANRKFRMPSSQRSQACFLLCLKKQLSAFHLNQAPGTLCSPFTTESLDVQLQVCSTQKHSGLFANPNPVPPSVRIDNIWVRLFLCAVFYGYLAWQSNVLPASPFSPQEREIYCLTKRDQKRHKVQLQLNIQADVCSGWEWTASAPRITNHTDKKSSFYWVPWCCQEQKDFE